MVEVWLYWFYDFPLSFQSSRKKDCKTWSRDWGFHLTVPAWTIKYVFFNLDLNFLIEFHHGIFSCHNSDMLFCLGSLLSFSSCISLVMLCFFNEIPRGNLCKFHKILLLMYSRMPWGSSGNWLIPIGKSLLLNQSYGRTWVGKALTHQQILGIHMFRLLMLYNCRLNTSYWCPASIQGWWLHIIGEPHLFCQELPSKLLLSLIVISPFQFIFSFSLECVRHQWYSLVSFLCDVGLFPNVVTQTNWDAVRVGVPFCCSWCQYIIYVGANVGLAIR